MSVGKRLLFSIITVLLVAAAIEGAARIVWWRLASRAFDQTRRRGEKLITGDPAAINFMKQPDGLYGYTLKPGFSQGGAVVNSQGFAQREVVPLERTPGALRVAALGESTTQGHNVDKGSYPTYLHHRLAASGRGYTGVEVINGGVAGWISDQVALRAEHQIAAFKPDIVVLYVGWNDFQAYDPYNAPRQVSAFETFHGGSPLHVYAASTLKSVALLSALYQKTSVRNGSKSAGARSEDATPEEVYRFYLRSFDRIVAAFRHANPNVRIASCTLVGRWPLDSEEDFASKNGRTWWMTSHKLTREDAADRLRHFNALIRRYAADHGLVLIDAAAAFEGLDRSRLQWDFAHMSFEGYELLAETMYEALRQAGTIQGDESQRRLELMVKYASVNNSDQEPARKLE